MGMVTVIKNSDSISDKLESSSNKFDFYEYLSLNDTSLIMSTLQKTCQKWSDLIKT